MPMTNEEQQKQNTKEHERIEATLLRIDRTLHGNGKEGLVTTVAKHSDSLGVLRRFLWAGLTFLLTIGSGFALAMLI